MKNNQIIAVVGYEGRWIPVEVVGGNCLENTFLFEVLDNYGEDCVYDSLHFTDKSQCEKGIYLVDFICHPHTCDSPECACDSADYEFVAIKKLNWSEQ